MKSSRCFPVVAMLFMSVGCGFSDNPDDPVATPAEDAAGLEGDVAQCSDGIDNDGNGYVDCEDFACLYTGSVPECEGPLSDESTDEACSDGIDNDRDGKLDCLDENCYWNADVLACDRDHDGYSPQGGDCFDHPNLDVSKVVNPGFPEMCGDGLDGDCDGSVDEEEGCIQLDLGLMYVSYVYDGDTVEVDGLGSVRLKGIDTPENWDGGPDGVECYGPESSALTRAAMEGKLVQVVLDPTDYSTDFKDNYDRWLAHFYLDDEQQTYHNGSLVEGGYACVWDSFDCITKVELLDLEGAAQSGDVGLWGQCGSQVCF